MNGVEKNRNDNLLCNNKGAALIVTLALVSILIAAALQLAKTTGESVLYTLKEKDAFTANEMAISGINFAKWLLANDANQNYTDSVQEEWADSDVLGLAVKQMGYDEDSLTINITDELGKIQVNALIPEYPGNQINTEQYKVIERFFNWKIQSDPEYEDRKSVAIINSLKDWLDSLDDDMITGLSGAESSTYKTLGMTYTCANGPFNHVDELSNVNGLTGIDPDSLGPYFTVYGLETGENGNDKYRYRGKININTAGVEILLALLPEGMEEQAETLVAFREEKDSDNHKFINSLDKGWYEKVVDLSENEKKRMDQLIQYSSDIFKVACTAKKNNASVTLTAFIKREKATGSSELTCRSIQVERR